MASSFSKNTKKMADVYEVTTTSITSINQQFHDFAAAINEVCNQASLFGRSLQSLEDLTIPEIIGSGQVNFKPKKLSSHKFTSSEHLSDSFVTFAKIMMSFSERIKIEAIDTFDNFIVQAVAPSNDEIKGIHEHNRQIINEFRECFFSLFNHFLVLAAELLEKFLVCNNCSTPFGFPHKPLCLTAALVTPNIWKKTKYDDKFITFGMKFSFHDILAPGCRKNILTKIANSCFKQSIAQHHEKPTLVLNTKNWLSTWARDEKDKKKKPSTRKAFSAPVQEHLFVSERSIWIPTVSDDHLLVRQKKN